MNNTVRSRVSPGSEPYFIPLPSSGIDRCSWLESHELDPEMALIAREDGESEEQDSEDAFSSEALPLFRLSDVEQRCLSMYYELGRTQDEIAAAEGCSQAMVAYHLRRASHRLRWLSGPGSWFTASQLYESCLGAGMKGLSSKVLADYWDSTSQTVTGERNGERQGWARHRIQKGREELCVLRDAVPYGKVNHFTLYDLGFDELERWGSNAVSRPRTEAHPQQASAQVRVRRRFPAGSPRGRSPSRTEVRSSSR